MAVATQAVPSHLTVLVVDDDALFINALRRSLLRLAPEWQVMTANGVQQSEAMMLSNQHVDMLITDRRMLDGAGEDLLVWTALHSPLTMRVLITGEQSEQVLLATNQSAHMLLAKPFSDRQLKELFDRFGQLQSMQLPLAVRELIGSHFQMPVLPAVYQHYVRLAEQDNTTNQQLAEVISQDIVMSSRLLQIANSAYLGFSRTTTSLSEAISRLGRQAVQSIVLSLSMFEHYAQRIDAKLHHQLQHDAMQLGMLCRSLSKHAGDKSTQQETAFMVGLLCQLGNLVWLTDINDEAHQKLQHAMTMQQIKPYQLSAYLLILWGFPIEVIRAIAGYAPFSDCLSGADKYTVILFVAHVLKQKQSLEQLCQQAPQLAEVLTLHQLDQAIALTANELN